jgi:hypothetical protein
MTAVLGRRNFMEEHRVHFAEIIKGVLDGRNSPRGIHEVLRTVRSCRGEKGYSEVFLSASSGEIWTMESKSTGAIGSLTRSHLRVS